MIFGSKDYQYSPSDLRESHKYLVKLGLNDTHFDRLISHLNSSLKELEVPDHEIEGIIEMLETMRAGSRYFCESLFWASQPKQAAKT